MSKPPPLSTDLNSKSHYNINITHKDKPYFLTGREANTTMEQAADVYFRLLDAFPESEGFHVTIDGFHGKPPYQKN